MSNDTLVVRFPDGDIRYGIYHGTSDTCYPNLFHCADDAWSFNRQPALSQIRPRRVQEEAEPVEIYSGYGWGSIWKGTATRYELVTGLIPFDEDVEEVWEAKCSSLDPEWDAPDWVKEAIAWRHRET